MRYWAVGEGKGWVELRAANKPPSQHTSEAVGHVKELTAPRQWRYGDPPWKPTLRKQRLVKTTWVGGKVVGNVACSVFTRLLHLNVLKGGCMELSTTQFGLLKEKLNG